MLYAGGSSSDRTEFDSLSGKQKESFFRRYRNIIIGIVAVAVIASVVIAIIVTRDVDQDEDLIDRMQIGNMMGHLNQLQTIANNNNGNRASGTTGYNQSIDYVVSQLKSHGYDPTVQWFGYDNMVTLSPPNITQVSPILTGYKYGTDFATLGSFAGLHDFNSTVSFVPNFGCYNGDYENFTINSTALMSRGNCTFAEKVALAVSMQAVAVIIYNQGDSPDRMGLYTGGLPGNIAVPVFATTYTLGVTFSAIPDLELNIYTNSSLVTTYTANVIAESKHGNSDSVVVVGSHLDSVTAGPGINDNGSGSSLNLELAIQMASTLIEDHVKNKVRFCWFGAEELGLLGSNYYVSNLNNTDLAELKKIQVNLNFDMVGSPNFFRGIYNGTSDLASPGSAVVQNLFENYYKKANLPTQPTEFSGRSDYGPFLAVGIPAGGLFTGAEAVKTMAQRTTYGGLAGASYDPCYHQACDNIENINQDVMIEMARGAATVLQQLVESTELVKMLNPDSISTTTASSTTAAGSKLMISSLSLALFVLVAII